MPCALDHLVVTAPALEDGARWVAQALGVAPGPGRKHPHMGTHNLLLSLGPAVYLEVVAVDPEAPPVVRPRWFGLDRLPSPPAAHLAAWVANTDDIHAHASIELGEVETMERAGLRWQMTSTPDGSVPCAGAAPLLIQRESGVHPAARLPDLGLRLLALHIRHPAPDVVERVLGRLALAPSPHISVRHGAACVLRAEIQTPQGLRVLEDRMAV